MIANFNTDICSNISQNVKLYYIVITRYRFYKNLATIVEKYQNYPHISINKCCILVPYFTLKIFNCFDALWKHLHKAKLKILVFRLTRPYLDLLVKPKIIFRFSGNNIKFYAFRMAKCLSKCIKLYSSHPQKNNQKKKYVCLPYLKFSDLLPETHLYFYLT